MSYAKTHNGGVSHDHSQNHALEFFSKAGSQFTNKKSYYGNESSALDLFKNVWFAGDHNLAMRLLFWLRDPRGGAGNRSGFRECLKWVSETEPKWVMDRTPAGMPIKVYLYRQDQWNLLDWVYRCANI